MKIFHKLLFWPDLRVSCGEVGGGGRFLVHVGDGGGGDPSGDEGGVGGVTEPACTSNIKSSFLC